MAQIYEFLLYGILLGLAQGLTPGPLITLIFSKTLKHGKKEGIKIVTTQKRALNIRLRKIST